jgi:hypothetical protein
MLPKVQAENSVNVSEVHQTSYPMVQRVLSSEVKRQGHEADQSPTIVPRARTLHLYTNSPIRLHGVVLS